MESRSNIICCYCNREIKDDEEMILIGDSPWHEDCYEQYTNKLPTQDPNLPQFD